MTAKIPVFLVNAEINQEGLTKANWSRTTRSVALKTGAGAGKQLFDCLLITKDNVDKYTGPFNLSQ